MIKNTLMIAALCVSVRETHGSGSNYHKELSKQLASFLERPLQVRITSATILPVVIENLSM